MTEFAGKNVLVTGAGHGIGKLVAEKIARLGGNMVLNDINQAALEETAQSIRNSGGSAIAYAFDISDRKKVYAAATKIRREVGRIHVLINNAGIVFTGEILDVPDENHLKIIDVNLCGTLWMLKAFAPDMMADGEGHIVNVASSAGMLGMPGMGVYSATKFALMGLSEALRLELGNRGSKVRLTVVCPYLIGTGMFEGMKTPFYLKLVQPEPMAEAIVKGIRNNRKIIGKPWTVFLPPIVKALFPPGVLDFMLRLTGFNRSVYHCKDFFAGNPELPAAADKA